MHKIRFYNHLVFFVSVNANFFPVQCSVFAAAALTRDRVFNFLPRKKKCYSLNFHVIDIKHLFQYNVILKSVFYLKSGLVNNINILNMAAIFPLQIKKWRWSRLSQIWRGKLSQVVCVCVCYNTIVVYTIHHRKLCTMFILNYIYIKRKCLSFF